MSEGGNEAGGRCRDLNDVHRSISKQRGLICAIVKTVTQLLPSVVGQCVPQPAEAISLAPARRIVARAVRVSPVVFRHCAVVT